jgi:glycosyltransferase involved in cell wall biosynthesis
MMQRQPASHRVPPSCVPGSLLYLGGFDLPQPQARTVQTLHMAHALAMHGCETYLAVGRAPRGHLAQALSLYGLKPLPCLKILSLATLRLPTWHADFYVHPRLAVWNWSYGLAALLALRLLPRRHRPSVVLARDPRIAWLFLQAQRWTGARVAYEVHELFSTRARQAEEARSQRPSVRAPRIRRLEESVFTHASWLIALTAACAQLLKEEFAVPSHRILVAPDAVSALPPRLPPREPGGRTVVYAGQLYPWKGVNTLVDAVALLPEAHLKIVGGLSESDPASQSLRLRVERLGLAGRTTFAGYVPHRLVRAATVGAAAAVVPLPDNPMSRFFTSPLKMFEYMASGVPVVASDLPALREVLHHERNALLVPPDDPPALARALSRLFEDAELAGRLRRTAFEDVRGHTWHSRARHVLDFLASA